MHHRSRLSLRISSSTTQTHIHPICRHLTLMRMTRNTRSPPTYSPLACHSVTCQCYQTDTDQTITPRIASPTLKFHNLRVTPSLEGASSHKIAHRRDYLVVWITGLFTLTWVRTTRCWGESPCPSCPGSAPTCNIRVRQKSYVRFKSSAKRKSCRRTRRT